MTFNFDIIEDNDYKNLVKNRVLKIKSIINCTDFSDIDVVLTLDILLKSPQETYKNLYGFAVLFPSLSEDEFLLLLKSHFVRREFLKNNFFEIKNTEDFVSILTELNFSEIEILADANEELFHNLQSSCHFLFKQTLDSDTLTEPFSYLQPREKEWFADAKNISTLNNDKTFELIQTIDRNYIPYHLNEKIYIILAILNYPDEDKSKTISILSNIKDPFCINDLLNSYIKDFDFLKILSLSKSKYLKCYSLFALSQFLEQLEIQYIKNIRELISGFIVEGNYSDIDAIIMERNDLLERNRQRLEMFIESFINMDKDNLSILISYMNSIFRVKSKDHGERPILLKSFEALFAAMLTSIANHFEDISAPIETFKKLLPLEDKNILYYGTLIWILFEKQKGEVFINIISKELFANFLKYLSKNELNTSLGFEYSYQIQYVTGLLNILVVDNKRKNNLNLLSELNGKLHEYSEYKENPFNKTLEEYYIYSNYSYYILLLLELKHQFHNTNLNFEMIDENSLKMLCQHLLKDTQDDRLSSKYRSILLNKICIVTLFDTSYDNLLNDNISSLLDIGNVLANKTDVKLILKNMQEIEDHFDFFTSNMDFNQKYTIYWQLFPFREVARISARLCNSFNSGDSIYKRLITLKEENNITELLKFILERHSFPINAVIIESLIRFCEIENIGNKEIDFLIKLKQFN
jgi:hypothetical protein